VVNVLYSLWSTTNHQTPVNGANIDARCRVALRGHGAAGSTMSCSRQAVKAVEGKGFGYSFRLGSFVIDSVAGKADEPTPATNGKLAATLANTMYRVSDRPAADQLRSNKPSKALSQPTTNGVVSETDNQRVLQFNNWILNRFHAPIPLGGNA
jgi:hypothetical protein